jgi:sodium-dependent phosphate cotransporter
MAIQIWLSLVVFFLFLLSLELITQSSHHLDSGFSVGILHVTGNPTVSLFIGLLATAIIQSSSTFTSSLVAMVAGNVLSLESAVFMVLGANIGTTVTSMMVSFGSMATPKAFRRGFMVASSHVIFNVLSALLFFVLETNGQILSRSSKYLAGQISTWDAFGEGWRSFIGFLVLPVTNLVFSLVQMQPIVSLGLGLILLFTTIYLLISIFKWIILGNESGRVIKNAVSNPLISMASGIGLTAAIHSSSVTTSLSVLLASTQKISPKKLFPFIIGSNVGTTITALLAAIGRSESAIALAICHFIFNLAGALFFYPFPVLRAFPMFVARWTADMAYKRIAFGFGYLVILFYILPFLVIFLSEKF